MEARHRLVRVMVGQVALGAVLIVALFALVLATLHGLPRTTHPVMLIAPRVMTSPEESPDAHERNATFAQASRSKWTNQSPDAQERNERLAK
ncbi:MAG TPA: hypothetical protein VHJ99_13065 [Candidatus Dormibacteraeota bacterium]|jgi:hypothetical protein|nr:hypothetical protein [Candidatus Dormibacteraeota bacterium]